MLKPQPFLTQLFDLTLVQLSNWRWSWRGMLVVSTLAPVMSMAALGFFARQSGPYTLGFILTGNMVLSLIFGTLNKVCSNFTFMRARGMLHYFATLPIHSASLILATVTAFFLLAVPSVLVTLALGVWYLGLRLHFSFWALLVLPLASVSLAGLGALIGTRARNPEEADSFSMVLSLLLVGIGPVLVPPERLPSFMVALGWFSPATYAASALRQTLLGPVTGRLWLDLAVLGLLSAAVLFWVGKVMNWRSSIE